MALGNLKDWKNKGLKVTQIGQARIMLMNRLGSDRIMLSSERYKLE